MTQKEKKLPEGLDEAAEEYRRESCNAALKPHIDGPTPEYGGSIKAAFIAGAEWQRAKMMEEGYDAFVSADRTIPVLPMKDVSGLGLNYGDKVRVIVIKEDEL